MNEFIPTVKINTLGGGEVYIWEWVFKFHPLIKELTQKYALKLERLWLYEQVFWLYEQEYKNNLDNWWIQ